MKLSFKAWQMGLFVVVCSAAMFAADPVSRAIHPLPPQEPAEPASSSATSAYTEDWAYEQALASLAAHQDEQERRRIIGSQELLASQICSVIGLVLVTVFLANFVGWVLERSESAPDNDSTTSTDPLAHRAAETAGRAWGFGERAFKSLKGSFDEGRTRTNKSPPKAGD